MEQPIAQPESPYEANRRIENLLRLCTVADVRTEHPARCRVQSGQLLTDWLPWLTLRAGGGAATWWAPAVGEQCLLLSPGGDLRRGVVLPGLYSDQRRPPSDDPADFVLRLGASQITITPSTITLAAGGGQLVINSAGAHGSPDVTAAGVSLIGHQHVGVTPGPALTGPPAGGS